MENASANCRSSNNASLVDKGLRCSNKDGNKIVIFRWHLGSGVAGAIYTAAGPDLEKFCQPFAPLELGAALITPGFNLTNPWIIHVRALITY
jgi:hypothetical protein